MMGPPILFSRKKKRNFFFKECDFLAEDQFLQIFSKCFSEINDNKKEKRFFKKGIMQYVSIIPLRKHVIIIGLNLISTFFPHL